MQDLYVRITMSPFKNIVEKESIFGQDGGDLIAAEVWRYFDFRSSLIDHSKDELENWTALRGHSNNTWHFFGTFLTPPPPVWHFSFSNHWFLVLNCSKTSNELERKYLMQPYLALWQKISGPKALITWF